MSGSMVRLGHALPAPNVLGSATTRSNCRWTRRCSSWSTSTAPRPSRRAWTSRTSRGIVAGRSSGPDRAGEGGRRSGRAPDRVRHKPAALRAVRRQRVADDVAADPSHDARCWRGRTRISPFRARSRRRPESVVEKQVFSGFFSNQPRLGAARLWGGACRRGRRRADSGTMLSRHTATTAWWRSGRVITNEYPETRDGMWASWLAIRQIESAVGYTSSVDEFIAACDDVAAAAQEDAR